MKISNVFLSLLFTGLGALSAVSQEGSSIELKADLDRADKVKLVTYQVEETTQGQLTVENADGKTVWQRPGFKDVFSSDAFQFLGEFDPNLSKTEEQSDNMPQLTNLRLVLRDKAYIDSRNSAILKLDDPKSLVISTPFSPSVVLILVSEQELSSLQIAEHHLVTLNISSEDAIALGRKQVLAQLPPLPGPAAFKEGVVVSPKIDYVASLLLADGWEQLDDALKGRLVAAVPSDDQVILANVDSDKMLEKLKTFVANAYTDANRSLSQSLFVRENGAWVELK